MPVNLKSLRSKQLSLEPVVRGLKGEPGPAGGLGTESDPVFTEWRDAYDHHANWDTAYDWGNHASAGYLTAASSLDPSKVSQTSGYRFATDAEKTAWNAKFTLPALTAGSILYSNGTTIAQDNSNLFWDDPNNRLGVGNSNPGAVIDSYGAGTQLRLRHFNANRYWDFTVGGDYDMTITCGGGAYSIYPRAVLHPIAHGWGSIVPAFSQPGYRINELTDILWLADRRFTVTGDAGVGTGLFDGDFNSIGWTIAASQTKTININIAGQSMIPVRGLTYPVGFIYISFYNTYHAYSSISSRVKLDGAWVAGGTPVDVAAKTTGASTYKVLQISVGGGAYLTDIEITITAGESNPVYVTAINYYTTRYQVGEIELPYITKYQTNNSLFGTLAIRSSKTTYATFVNNTTGVMTGTAYGSTPRFSFATAVRVNGLQCASGLPGVDQIADLTSIGGPIMNFKNGILVEYNPVGTPTEGNEYVE